MPLEIALISLVVAREWTERILNVAKSWLERHAMQVFGVIVLLLAAALLRNGISGLTS